MEYSVKQSPEGWHLSSVTVKLQCSLSKTTRKHSKTENPYQGHKLRTWSHCIIHKLSQPRVQNDVEECCHTFLLQVEMSLKDFFLLAVGRGSWRKQTPLFTKLSQSTFMSWVLLKIRFEKRSSCLCFGVRMHAHMCVKVWRLEEGTECFPLPLSSCCCLWGSISLWTQGSHFLR